jgi:hypothetical protein
VTTYKVLWVIDIGADSPREAAEAARATLRNPESTAWCFVVVPPSGTATVVDLDEVEAS